MALASPMIQILQASPIRRRSFRLFNTKQREAYKKQALLIGTEKSGKKAILQQVENMESPLEIICLSSDVPISRYNNFLYDIPYVIFVFDSTRLSIDYLERVRLMLKHIFRCNSSSEKLLILLNKTDVITVVNSNVLEKYLRLDTLDMEYLIIPSSGKSGYGISEGMNWLLR